MGKYVLNLTPTHDSGTLIARFCAEGLPEGTQPLEFSDEVSDIPFELSEIMCGCAADECVLVGVADMPLTGKRRALIHFSVAQSRGRFLS